MNYKNFNHWMVLGATLSFWCLAGMFAATWFFDFKSVPTFKESQTLQSSVPYAQSHWTALAFGPEIEKKDSVLLKNSVENSYTLIGLAAGEHGQGVVLIAVGPSNVKAFGLGDELEPGVVIKNISESAVEISTVKGVISLSAPPKPKMLPPLPQ